jgi:hypothetical protein
LRLEFGRLEFGRLEFIAFVVSCLEFIAFGVYCVWSLDVWSLFLFIDDVFIFYAFPKL